MDRMKELVEILNNASREYYQKDNSIMSDHDYDKLYDELLELENETGIVLSQSPTRKVGYEVLSSLTKVRHDSKMLSLDKTKDVLKLKNWLGNQKGLLSWKLDGLTIVLKYENGVLSQAITRGNGEVGEDITHNARTFKNVPQEISYKNPLTIRGEGVISYSEFKKINELLSDENKYKNPRNLCSGTVRQLNSEICAKRNVMFYAFSVITADDIDFNDERNNQLIWLTSMGFDVVESRLVDAENIEDAVSDFESRIDKNDFASDGLVLTFNSISYSSNLGQTAKFPKDSIAFKWADEMAETTLEEVFWSTSRTGLINPIAIFSPVELEGTTVNRASVHNLSILEELELVIGDKIKVYKANMIIPQIAENLTRSGNVEIPQYCYVCGGETEVRVLREGKALYCTNPNCKAQQVLSITHYVSRDAVNIEGLSEETINKFVEKGFLSNYTDLYNLYKFKDEIISMEGFGEKSFSNLIESIEKSKVVMLPNFIYALGINHIGLSNAKLLCKAVNNDIEKIKNITADELVSIDGFGEIIAHSIFSYFHNEENIELLDKVLTYLKIEKEEQSMEQSLNTMTFVITGDVEHFKNRNELKAKIESMGGKVTGSVTKKTNYLINNDLFSESSKNQKAKELGVQIISENEFIEKFLKD